MKAKEEDPIVSMNFKVEGSFRIEYKKLAASEGVSMLDIFKESFELYKKENKK